MHTRRPQATRTPISNEDLEYPSLDFILNEITKNKMDIQTALDSEFWFKKTNWYHFFYWDIFIKNVDLTSSSHVTVLTNFPPRVTLDDP